jgi:hypothetical protein
MSDCVCQTDPMASKCGQWEDNESACFCAELGVIAETGRSLPS